jgi:hypothetical protein
MAWRIEDTDEGQDIVYDGVEFGVAASPLKGTANLQNVNIATETGEVMASFARTALHQTALSNQTLTPDGATLFDAPAALRGGQWIKVTASTVSSITAATNPTTFSIDYLAVGGGGGSGGSIGSTASGGGGGGEVATGSDTLTVGTFNITVGDGGAQGQTSNGVGGTGGSTIIETVDTAVGGGGGGAGADNLNGASGASGGGGGGGAGAGTGGAATAGNTGGAGNGTSPDSGGGGGGAGAVGTAGTAGVGGNGGNGTASSITGTSITYGGGGGGGAASGTAGIGGTGGGGNGGVAARGTVGTPNTGGGGGGGSETNEGRAGGSGIAVIRYVTGTAFCTGGDEVYQLGVYTVHIFKKTGTFTVLSINSGGLYFVSYASGGKIKLSDFYDPYGSSPITHGSTGSITFSTVAVPNQAIAKATENYNTATTTEYRYYILDNNGYVWVFDTQAFLTNGFTWMLTDPVNYSTLSMGGMGILNGWLIVVSTKLLYSKPTVDLGTPFVQVSNGFLTNPFSTHRNFAMVGSQGKLYYTDNQFIGEVFPTTSLVTSEANIQSYGKYAATSTVCSLSVLINGSTPYLTSGKRVPAVFFTDSKGTLPTAITGGFVYYIEYSPQGRNFTVHVAPTSNIALDMQTGAVGNQYFNTFFPAGQQKNINNVSTPLFQFQPQRLNLPFFEQATTLAEIGNTILIGCEGTALYPWNQVDAIPSDVIQLPEANVKTIINVNNMAYVFAGNKGNIYVTNNTVASLALKVPDYCAGVPGNPLSYIEPYFSWGDAMFLRGRVYFSILDQTATKAGNCGGVWSFVPTQNIDPNQEIGMALRLENQNSYGDYDGYATILIPAMQQNAIAPQYWAAWQDAYNGGNYGIDGTASSPVTSYALETDLLATGTLFSKDTFSQLEYKLSTPLAAGDSVQLFWRLSSTDAWTSAGTVQNETAFPISGLYQMEFQKTQWLQFRAVITTSGTTASSFVRLTQLRLR